MTRRLKIGSCNTHHRSVEADSIQTVIQWSTWGELKWAKSHTLLSKPKSTFQKKKKINGQIQLGQSFWQRKSLILSKPNSSLFNFEISCKHLHISVSFFANRIVRYSSVFHADKDTKSSQVYCIIIKIPCQNVFSKYLDQHKENLIRNSQFHAQPKSKEYWDILSSVTFSLNYVPSKQKIANTSNLYAAALLC